MSRYRYRSPRRGRWSRRYEPSAVLFVTEDDPLVVRALAAFGHAAWRYRSELAPVTVALSLALCGTWAHHRHPGLAIPLAVLTAAATAVLGVRPGRWSVGRWLAARSTVVARPTERLYAASVLGLAGAWLTAATVWGPSTPPLPTVAMLGVLAAGLPWWVHRRRRARVRVERTLAAWPTFADAVGLPGSRLVSAVVDRWGWTARMSLRRGQSAQHAIAAVPAIESALAVRPGAVRIEPDPVRADRAVLRVVETDPHADPIPWREPTAVTVAAPVEVGVFEDGSPVRVRLLYRNTLVGGMSGSGKSGVLNVLLAALVGCRDVVVWGIDLKGGMELAPWASCLGRLATTPADAVALLRDAVAELDRRASLLTAAGQRLWQPTRDRPALLVLVDEYAELPDAAHPLADSIARRGRAVAVTLLAATQRPTQKAMGHGAVRSQMDVRICLRVRERRDADLILGQGTRRTGKVPALRPRAHRTTAGTRVPHRRLRGQPHRRPPRRPPTPHHHAAGSDQRAARQAGPTHPAGCGVVGAGRRPGRRRNRRRAGHRNRPEPSDRLQATPRPRPHRPRRPHRRGPMESRHHPSGGRSRSRTVIVPVASLSLSHARACTRRAAHGR